jgi:LAO/AO transport system kinase
LVHKKHGPNYSTQIVKTVAIKNEGIDELNFAITNHLSLDFKNSKKTFLLAEKAYELLKNKRMKAIDKKQLLEKIEEEQKNNDFNLYVFVNNFPL